MENVKILLASVNLTMIALLQLLEYKSVAMGNVDHLKNVLAKHILIVGLISLLHGIAVMVIAQPNPVNAKQMMNVK